MGPRGFASFQHGDNCVACGAVAANLKRRSGRWYIQDETELVFPLRKRTFLRKLSYDELGNHAFTFFSPIEPSRYVIEANNGILDLPEILSCVDRMIAYYSHYQPLYLS